MHLQLVFFFALEDEWYWQSNYLNEFATDHHQILTFPNTVRLRLSLQRISDLALIVKRGTLPCLEHLHVTLEKEYFRHPSLNQSIHPSCPSLCPEDLNSSRADLPHLRTLHLQQVSIGDAIILMQYLKSMSQIVSLILVNCNVKGMYRY